MKSLSEFLIESIDISHSWVHYGLFKEPTIETTYLLLIGDRLVQVAKYNPETKIWLGKSKTGLYDNPIRSGTITMFLDLTKGYYPRTSPTQQKSLEENGFCYL